MSGLQVSGKVLDVEVETVQGASGSFVSTTVHILSGKARVERVRIGRDFPTSQIPKEGEDVALAVFVSAWVSKQGAASYNLTATERISSAPGARIAAAS